jgi:hypothetical protein
MSPMKQIASLILLSSCVTGTVRSADAPELDRLKESYRAAIQRVQSPVVQNYLAELTRLRASLAKAANLEAANKVQEEIDATYQGLAFKSETPLPQAAAPKEDTQEKRVSIPANDVNGFKIGPLKKGSVITVSFVGGGWKPDGKVASDSPEVERPERGEKSRLVIANGRYKTQAGPVLAVVPAGTSIKPYSYTLTADVENVVLRINEDGNNYADNPGSVTYKLKVSH